MAIVVGIGACEPSGLPPDDQPGQARQIGIQLSTALASRSYRPACGTTPSTAEDAPDLAMLVTVPQAMSCRDLGFTLRRLPNDGGRTWVLIPEADTTALCSFLRTERVRLTVMSLPDPATTLSTARPVIAVMPGDGKPDRHFHAVRGADILRQLRPEAGNRTGAVP
ncbi:hypothetical protein [Longimicrobium sp.]|uniref:hypothetical protein n=1 Tax=Longimicrobium sp. TaxID=2029185 RepID=UPI002E3707F3|nr:hypothetical protein [Longimicrobium sp.]HEX6042543.1 hypothetical protein [Longimicrobium sp.]